MSRAASALTFLAKRRSLTPRQAEAAQRLVSSYRLGIVGYRLHDGVRGAMPAGYMDARVAAMQDYERARGALGARLWPVVWGIICGDQSVQEYSVEQGISPVAAMTTLRIGLDILGDHWELHETD